MTEEAPGGAPTHNDEPEALLPVLAALRALDPVDIAARLDAKLEEDRAVDPEAGIAIVPLVHVAEAVVDGQAYHFHGARVMPEGPGRPNFVNPHVHEVGDEPYIFLDGDGGEMNKGVIEGGRVVWEPPRTVRPGEVEIVKPGEVHSFRNANPDPAQPFDFAFACPDNHLKTKTAENPNGDRQFTKDIGVANPLPIHYPQPVA